MDVLVALLLAGIGLASLFGGAAGERPPDLLAVVLVLAGAGSLPAVRRYPIPVLAATVATSVAIDQLGHPQHGLGLTVLWALYVGSLRLPRRTSVLGTLGALAVVNLSLLISPGTRSAADHVSTTVILGAGWVCGQGVQGRRSRVEAEERAAVAEERTRVAREMQDLVAHELAELTVQVTAARRLAGRDPVVTEELLAGAESSSRAAVAEVRRILTLLTPAGAADDQRLPLPGIVDLPGLARRHTDRGLPVLLRQSGSGGVAAGPGLLAYRVAELALEEAWRTGAGRAEMSVDVGADGLRVRVSHERLAAGPSTADVTGSASVSGLVRRAQLYGGTVNFRTGPSGGSVALQIPAGGRGGQDEHPGAAGRRPADAADRLPLHSRRRAGPGGRR